MLNGAKLYDGSLEKTTVSNDAVLRRYYVRTDRKDTFLEGVAEDTWGPGLITRPVPVSEMHKWKNEDPDGIFFAALPD